MKWSELKKEIDTFLNGEDSDIIYIDTGNFPKKVNLKKDEFGFIVERVRE